MDKLLAYLNSLARPEQLAFAERCKTSLGYLRKACSTGQALGAELCVAIEQESGNKVLRQDLRKNWRLIWPELAGRGAPRRRKAA